MIKNPQSHDVLRKEISSCFLNIVFVRPEILAGNEYHTPETAPRLLLDRLLFNTRFAFLSQYIGIILETRSAAKRGIYDTQAWVDSSHKIFSLIEGCGGRFHITGIDNIRNQKSPVLFLSNHMSTLETMIFPGLIQPLINITFVVKDALVRHWAFRDVMLSRKPIVLSRENPRQDLQIVLEQGEKLLASGMSIVIFPQSTRRVEFRPAEFNSLGTKLASRAGVKVIPVAIKTDFWGHGKVSKYLGPIDKSKPIHIAFGEPIAVSGNGKSEHQQVIDFIKSHLEVWNA